MYRFSNVDTDLFVKAQQAGTAMGNATPNFFDAIQKGIGQGMQLAQSIENLEATQQNNEIRQNEIDNLDVTNAQKAAVLDQTLQNNVLRQNEIDMLPSTNAVKELQGTKAELEAQIYAENPELLKNLQVVEAQTALSKKLEVQQLMEEKVAFNELMQQNDPLAIGQAVSSGRFNRYFSEDPKAQERALKSFNDWGLNEKVAYVEAEKGVVLASQAKNRFSTIKPEEAASIQKDYLDSPFISSIASEKKKSPNSLVFDYDLRTRQLTEGGVGGVLDASMGGAGSSKVQYFLQNKSDPADTIILPDAKTAEVFNRQKNAVQALSGTGPDTPSDLRSRLTEQQRKVVQRDAEVQAKAAEMAQKNGAVQEERFFKGREFGRRYQSVQPILAEEVKQNISELSQPQAQPRQAPAQSQGPSMRQSLAVGQSNQANAPANMQGAPAPASAASNIMSTSLASRMSKPPPVAGAQQGATPAVSTPAASIAGIPSNIIVASKQPVSDTVVERIATDPQLSGMPAIFQAVLAAESGGVHSTAKGVTKSPTGVQGIAQMEQRTMRDVLPKGNVRNKEDSIVGGAMHLGLLMHKVFPNNPAAAITAYNLGEGAMAQAIQKAGTTDWETVKSYIPGTPEKKREAQAYLERVLPYFVKFAKTSNDRKLLERFKEQGLVDY